MGANGRAHYAQILPGEVSHGRVAMLVGLPPFQGLDTFFNRLVHVRIKAGLRIEVLPFLYTFDPSSESPAWSRVSVAAKVSD